MTFIPEEIAVKMIRNCQSLKIECSINPGYGIGFGVVFTVSLIEHDVLVHQSHGSTVEKAIEYMVNSEAFSKAVV